MIRISKIIHRDQERLKLDFPYDVNISEKINKKLNGLWSKTHKAWHVPYTEEVLEELKEMFQDIVFDENIEKKVKVYNTKTDATNHYEEKANLHKKIYDRNIIKIEVIGRKIILKMPKNDADVKFVNTLKYSKWDSRMFCWEIPNYPGNLDLINDYFKDRIDELIIHENFDISINNETRTVGKKELIIIKTQTGRLKLIFGFENDLRKLIKSYPYNSWDAKNKWWTIPFSEKYLNEIRSFALEAGMKVSFEEEKKGSEGLKRVSAFDIPNYRECPEEMILKLKELRYSENTIKTYKGLFEEFINYYHKFDIDKIEEPQIISFLRFLVMERKVSTSYQNQSINSIKFYYEKVLGGQRKFYFIERPRTERTLPTVLNKDEVIRLFKSVDNIKHKCMLMIAYSAGLRLGEILRLRIIDIDRERMQIRVEQSKGKKDRYTKLSEKFIVVLDEYIEEYHPKDLLIEGATGGNYSPGSLQNIIKAIAQKAGIQKRTTMNTLRHTFGTHCLEDGIDLRYIQSMMGHYSSKTTEIYTHITTRGFDQLRSPLDNLDI
ncbi:MAG: tyrosine-type recombinase/integrase [Bacteroidota bacterium]